MQRMIQHFESIAPSEITRFSLQDVIQLENEQKLLQNLQKDIQTQTVVLQKLDDSLQQKTNALKLLDIEIGRKTYETKRKKNQELKNKLDRINKIKHEKIEHEQNVLNQLEKKNSIGKKQLNELEEKISIGKNDLHELEEKISMRKKNLNKLQKKISAEKNNLNKLQKKITMGKNEVKVKIESNELEKKISTVEIQEKKITEYEKQIEEAEEIKLSPDLSPEVRKIMTFQMIIHWKNFFKKSIALILILFEEFNCFELKADVEGLDFLFQFHWNLALCERPGLLKLYFPCISSRIQDIYHAFGNLKNINLASRKAKIFDIKLRKQVENVVFICQHFEAIFSVLILNDIKLDKLGEIVQHKFLQCALCIKHENSLCKNDSCAWKTLRYWLGMSRCPDWSFGF